MPDLRRIARSNMPPYLWQLLRRSRIERSPKPFFQTLAAHMLDKNVRGASERLRGLAGRYQGQRCFIMGNGPSLNRMELELLRNEYVWGLNKCYLLFDRISWRPAFFTAVDTRVVPDIRLELDALSASLPNTLFFFPLHYRENGVLRSNDNVYWYYEVSLDREDLPNGMFSRDASRWVTTVSTVTVAALQLAVYLGFSPIYLIGCDTNYTVAPTVVRDKDDWNKLVSTKDDDLNHFDPRYFGSGSKWHEPRVHNMFFHYEQANRVCDSLRVPVYNATVGGKLEVFPRVDYERLFEADQRFSPV